MEKLKDIDVSSITFIAGLVYVIVLGVVYYLLFHKHHKRNKIDFSELISLVTRFYTRTTIAILFLILSGYCIVMANEYKETRSEVVSIIVLGIVIASVTIINYIYYIKDCLRDPNPEVRATTKKATIRIGEILEFIIFTIFIFMPLWRIPNFISLVPEKEQLIKEIVITFAISFSSMFLMYGLNPLHIKERLTKKEIIVKEDSDLTEQKEDNEEDDKKDNNK